MSSGSLPLATYHRANSLGAGAYGSVVTVYDEEGNEFALKLFDDEDDDSENDDHESEYDNGTDQEYEDGDGDSNNDEEEEYNHSSATKPMELGALREICILRILREQNAHPNVIAISDVKQSNDITEEVDGDVTMHYLGIAMPLFKHGTLTLAIESATGSLHKKNKVQIAHGILAAVAYLHTNGIIHRDIKTDNIMIEIDDEGDYHPILIDFSLAKMIVPQHVYSKSSSSSSSSIVQQSITSSPEWETYFHSLKGEDTHTPSSGTPTYRSPECVNEQPYGLPSDMYSVGIVLLELLRGSCIEAFKDKGAAKIVASEVEALPNQPFANLVRGLVEKDPEKRLDCREALDHELFVKFCGLFRGEKKEEDTFRILDLKKALPLDDQGRGGGDEEEKVDDKMIAKAMKKRMKMIRKIAHDLESENPLTVQAALCYSIQLSQLDDGIDDLDESQGLIDCVVLAHKFFERELWDLKSIEDLDSGVFRKVSWSLQEYVDNEATIWMLMDFCLYPRELVVFGE
jgi:serine/threonine protein kinase